MNVADLVAALDLPAAARVDRCVPKTLRLERGALMTPPDKPRRSISFRRVSPYSRGEIGRGGSPPRANRQSSRRASRCNATHYGESTLSKPNYTNSTANQQRP